MVENGSHPKESNFTNAFRGNNAKGDAFPSFVDVNEENAKREFCSACFKAASVCICSRFKKRVQNRTAITILQHPKEKFHPLGSARVALLGLANVRVIVAPLGVGRPRVTSKLPGSNRSVAAQLGLNGRSRCLLKYIRSAAAMAGSTDFQLPTQTDSFLTSTISASNTPRQSRVLPSNQTAIDSNDLCCNGSDAIIRDLNSAHVGAPSFAHECVKKLYSLDSSNFSILIERISKMASSMDPAFSAPNTSDILLSAETFAHEPSSSSSSSSEFAEQSEQTELSGSHETISSELSNSNSSNLSSPSWSVLPESCSVDERSEVSMEFPSWLPIDEGTALLYPSPQAIDLPCASAVDFRNHSSESMADGSKVTRVRSEANGGRAFPTHFIVLDGTWPKAKRLYHQNPWLVRLPHYRLPPIKPSSYGSIRKEPEQGCVSTIEAIVYALKAVEPDTEDLDSILEVFDSMVKDQIRCMPERVRNH